MKKCPFCAEEIQGEALVCKHCGKNLVEQPKVKQKRKTTPVAMGCAVLMLLFIGFCVYSMNQETTTPSTTQQPAQPPVPQQPKLALLSASGYETEGGGFFVVEGQVKNVSDEPLENVAVVATWFTQDDTFITSDDAIIDYNPILPGQTSPFKTMSRSNPAMSKYTLDFKELFGGTIAFEDQR